MQPANKLPLVRRSMKMLIEQLTGRDRVAIVVYAGASGLVLPSTPCNETGAISGAIDNLHAGGSTNGGAGIKLAYDVAVKNFIKGGVNRVILCTDGDFNVGVTNNSELERLIEAKAKTGVFISVLGFGMGNYKDARLEKLADKGNGNYAYIDTQREARKVLVDQMAGTLIAIAKDVKIQIEFNPRKVEAFRLLGYENRVMAHQDFRDDTKDAGEIGSGHTVTALYEVIPAGQPVKAPDVKPLKYQARNVLKAAAGSNDILTLWLRYKKPEGKDGLEMEVPVADHGLTYTQASRDFKFAASVAAFAMLLRDSKYKGIATYAQVLELAEEGKGQDLNGHRAEFLKLVQIARGLKR
jgi:Ca-activated chloride channel family protein